MKRILILTCKPVLMWQDAQLLRGLFAQETAPELVETSTTAQLLAALEERLPLYDLFVIAAVPASFNELKLQLLACLGFACSPRPEIMQLQKNTHGEDALFPPSAHMFLTQNACYSGFALHSGRQDLLMLPLETDLLGHLAPQVREFLDDLLPDMVQAVYDPQPDLPADSPASALDLHLMRLGHRCAASIVEISPADIEPLTYVPTHATVFEEHGEMPAAVPANRSRGRGRAMVAASLALCSLVASVFLTIYFSSRNEQPEIIQHEVPPAAAAYIESANLQAAGLQDLSCEALTTELLQFISLTQKILASCIPPCPATTTKPPVTKAPTTTNSPTTKAPTTTRAPTTTQQPITTTRPPATTMQPSAVKGVFRFEVQGYGHGVGMSQEGAREYARQGWNYEQILKHYYSDSGISIAKETAKATITHGGKAYGITEYLVRIAFCEIGGPNHSADEAIKAQMVCAYTIAKRNGYKTTENNQHILPDSKWKTAAYQQYKDKMYALAESVLGRYVSYNGKAADTLVFASCAGMTASAKYAWSGNEPEPYLRGGRFSPERIDRSSPVFTRSEIQTMVNTYNGKNAGNKITLGGDPRLWIQILRTDTNGYVEQLQIGDRKFTGGNARLYFFGSTVLRSHNFTVYYE